MERTRQGSVSGIQAYLKQLPILEPPKEDEVMLLYMAATPKVVSVVLVVERQVENPQSITRSIS